MALAEQAQPALTGSRQIEWLDRLETEHDNVRAALQWSLQRGHVEIGARLGGALWRFWQVRGFLSEGRAWLEKVLEAARASSVPRSTCVQAVHGAGVLAYEQGDIDHAQMYFEDSLILRNALGDKRGMAASLNNVANIAIIRGDYARAMSIYEESRDLWQEIGDTWGLATCLNNLGLLAHYQRDYACAEAFYEQSLSLSRESGDKRNAAVSLNSLGDVMREQNALDRAETFYAESLACWRELGDKRGMATSFNNLGLLAHARGDYSQALGFCRQGLALCREVGEQNGSAMCLDRMAQALGALGQAASAAQLMGAAQAIRIAANVVMAHDYRLEHDEMVRALRAQLDEPAFTAAWNQGRAMPLDQVIAYAMEDRRAT
jgi:tetratricopeptide (TPR) repeat protein